jgi:hypothetical protein
MSHCLRASAVVIGSALGVPTTGAREIIAMLRDLHRFDLAHAYQQVGLSWRRINHDARISAHPVGNESD